MGSRDTLKGFLLCSILDIPIEEASARIKLDVEVSHPRLLWQLMHTW